LRINEPGGMFDIRNLLMSFRFEMNNGRCERGRQENQEFFNILRGDCKNSTYFDHEEMTFDEASQRKIEFSSRFDYTFSLMDMIDWL